MEGAYKKLEEHLPSAVDEVMAVEKKWSDLKIIHSILQDVKDESGSTITSADAAKAVEIFLGERGRE
jgi:hypothetical protein